MSITFPFVPKYGTEDQVNNQPITTGSMYMTPGKLFFDKSSTERVIIASKDSNYVYNQIIPSDTWSINHNLKKLPNVTAYHADSKECRLYQPKEMTALIQTAIGWITYHTTYFNLLKHQIMELTSVDEVKSVVYGTLLGSERQALLDVISTSLLSV